MQFAGKVWRLLVGIKDGLVLVFMLLFFTALFAVLTARPSPAAVRDGALLLDLSGVVVEERIRKLHLFYGAGGRGAHVIARRAEHL